MHACVVGKRTKGLFQFLKSSTKYLLSVTPSLLFFPAIFIANWPNASPVGTRRAIAVMAGADDLNYVYY
jgi:hypothetical protein